MHSSTPSTLHRVLPCQDLKLCKGCNHVVLPCQDPKLCKGCKHVILPCQDNNLCKTCEHVVLPCQDKLCKCCNPAAQPSQIPSCKHASTPYQNPTVNKGASKSKTSHQHNNLSKPKPGSSCTPCTATKHFRGKAMLNQK